MSASKLFFLSPPGKLLFIEIICRSVSHRNVGMVQDGAKCGKDDEGICLSGACIPKTDILMTDHNCPTNNLALECSGHGVCTTENWCYCNNGWKGSDCGTRTAITQPSSPSIINNGIDQGLGTKPYGRQLFS